MTRTAKRAPARRSPEGQRAAGDVVMEYVAVQVHRLKEAEPAVRADEPDAVHQMRVALRRLRSVLSSYRPLFDATRTEPLRAELAWLAGVLGPARDLEVLQVRLAERLRVDGRADMLLRTQVDHQLTARRTRALEEVRWVLDGERYANLLDTLSALVLAPPLTGEAARAASTVLPRRVGRSWRRLRTAVRASRAPGLDSAARTEALHEARKGAKRARYAAEVAQPLLGRPAEKFVREMTRVQTALGHAQDGAVSVQELDRLAPGVDNALPLGRVQVLEEQRLTAQVGRFGPVWKRAAAPKRLRWLP